MNIVDIPIVISSRAPVRYPRALKHATPMFYPSYNQTTPFSSPNEARSEASSVHSDVASLKMDVERLLMITEALWKILKEKHGYEENELIKQIVEIDMRDGKLDGKVAPEPPQKCPRCSRTLFKSRPRCLYCGEPVVTNPFQR